MMSHPSIHPFSTQHSISLNPAFIQSQPSIHSVSTCSIPLGGPLSPPPPFQPACQECVRTGEAVVKRFFSFSKTSGTQFSMQSRMPHRRLTRTRRKKHKIPLSEEPMLNPQSLEKLHQTPRSMTSLKETPNAVLRSQEAPQSLVRLQETPQYVVRSQETPGGSLGS